jgi:nucleotide-binding universal stress UspA family protein
MAVRDILVCIDGSAAGKLRFELALNLAQAQKAHLTVVYILPETSASKTTPVLPGLPPTVLGPVSPDGAATIGGEPIAARLSAGEALPGAEEAAAAEQRFREELALRGIAGEWCMLDRVELAALIQLAKAADLVVLGQYPADEADGGSWLKPDDLMIDIGRPVLVVPYAGIFREVGRRVLIAWDATREANRALHDALPVMGNAEEVVIVHIGQRESDLDADRPTLDHMVRHLARHEIAARPEESRYPDVGIADALLSRAADLGADMIVAGAYHHSPLRENLLGGVSRSLLEHMTVPVLMSH